MHPSRAVLGALVALALTACGGPLTNDAQNARIVTPPTVTPATVARRSNPDVENDLRNALTAEKTGYTDTMMYTAAPASMKVIEPSLGWGKQIQVKVGDATTPGDRNVVCIAETSASGVQYAIGDVASGPKAGTFYGRRGCPARMTATSVSALAGLGVQSVG